MNSNQNVRSVRSVRHINEENITLLFTELSKVNWEFILKNSTTDVKQLYNSFVEVFGSIYDHCFPKQQPKDNRKEKRNP